LNNLKRKKMQVILGAGGAIGTELAKELKKYTQTIRLISRNPKKINEDDELMSCDLTNREMVHNAIKGADVTYLTAGLKYDIKIWEQQWPMIMDNVISACKSNKSRLVFFDNIYVYNPEKLNPMTEETEILPSSKKGRVREKIAQMILDEIKKGTLKAMIVRSADFYGPGIQNSVFIETVFNNLKAGKKAMWMCSPKYLHSLTYTPDAAKATALLGNTDSAFGQVWHVPTAPPLTGEEWIKKAANELGVKSGIQVVPKFMVRVLGLFNPIMKEFVEMLYQYDRHYNFDSSKFESVFQLKPTPVDEAMKQIVNAG